MLSQLSQDLSPGSEIGSSLVSCHSQTGRSRCLYLMFVSSPLPSLYSTPHYSSLSTVLRPAVMDSMLTDIELYLRTRGTPAITGGKFRSLTGTLATDVHQGCVLLFSSGVHMMKDAVLVQTGLCLLLVILLFKNGCWHSSEKWCPSIGALRRTRRCCV